MNYFEVNGWVSNSDLKHFQRTKMQGQAPLQVNQGMIDGRALHAGLLEPHLAPEWALHDPRVLDYQRSWLAPLIQVGKKEHEFYRVLGCDYGKLYCRGKVDLWLPEDRTVIDFKFMSQPPSNPANTIQSMDYDQQAAMYLMLARADTFIFAFNPDCTYRIKRGDEMHQSGQRKLNKVINAYALYQLFTKQ